MATWDLEYGMFFLAAGMTVVMGVSGGSMWVSEETKKKQQAIILKVKQESIAKSKTFTGRAKKPKKKKKVSPFGKFDKG